VLYDCDYLYLYDFALTERPVCMRVCVCVCVHVSECVWTLCEATYRPRMAASACS
jgi:hypothetical protein